MATQNKGNIRKYKKPLNLNIGMIFFAVIMIYIIICIFMYFSSKRIYGYQVRIGSLSETNVYEGIAFRDETIVTSEYSGYINYFAREGEKAGCNKLVCTVDETGSLQELVQGEQKSEELLSEMDLSKIKSEVKNFISSYQENNFHSTYDFKFLIEGSVLKYANRNLLNSLNELYSNTELNGAINVCNAPKSGIVIYSIDGFEDREINEICEDWFLKENYEKTQLINNEIVEKGDPIYKLSTEEKWCIVIPVEEGRAKELEEEEYVKVRFLKNQYESWGEVEVLNGSDQKTYVKLTFTNSMITFATDRFVDIELITDAETGLKVPNSSIIKKEFFLIPTAYVTKGGNGNENGVLRETYNEDGSMIPEFVPVSIYNEEEGEYYIDDASLRIGDTIDMPDSTEKFTIAKSGTLIGVYNINKGYADFKQIQILNQNDEYAIIQSNTKYGLVAYDYIAQDAESINDNDFIND